MSLKYYRGLIAVQDFIIKYLTYVFYANSKGQIDFFDGVKKPKFSKIPYVVKRSSWDFRTVPCILVSYSNANLELLSFEKDYVGGEDDTSSGWKEYGGQIMITVKLDIYGSTIEERDNLVDIVSIFMSNPLSKDYLYKQDIALPEGPDIYEVGPKHEPQIDQPVYVSSISVKTVSSWRERESEEFDRLAEIIVELDLGEPPRVLYVEVVE